MCSPQSGKNGIADWFEANLKIKSNQICNIATNEGWVMANDICTTLIEKMVPGILASEHTHPNNQSHAEKWIIILGILVVK